MSEIFRSLLDRVFALPPAEQRPDIRRSYIKRLGLPRAAVSEKNDTYLYYLCVLWSMRFAVVVAAFILLTHTLERSLTIGPFSILYLNTDAWHGLIRQYVVIVKYGLLGVALPYFLIKFRWNIDPKQYDLLWTDSGMRSKRGYNRHWIVGQYAVLLIILTVGVLWALAPPDAPLFFKAYASSLAFYLLLLFYLVLSCLTSVMISMIIMCIGILWRYLDPRSGRSKT